jgi:FkbM family methyltransferase
MKQPHSSPLLNTNGLRVNFSGIPANTIMGRILRSFLKLVPTNIRMPILQGRLRGKQWIVGSSVHGCWLGSYEHEKQLIFEQWVTEGSVVFDIGAHVGFYTLLASVLVGLQGRVFAFEPVPHNLYYLKEHLRLNHIGNVTVMEVAVSDFQGVAFFDEGPSSSMGHIAPVGGLKVKTVSLDELTSSGKIPTPNYVKIDVEGTEMLVLTGAKSILSEVHPTLFLATHSHDLSHQCYSFLVALGYRIKHTGGKHDEILAY